MALMILRNIEMSLISRSINKKSDLVKVLLESTGIPRNKKNLCSPEWLCIPL